MLFSFPVEAAEGLLPSSDKLRGTDFDLEEILGCCCMDEITTTTTHPIVRKRDSNVRLLVSTGPNCVVYLP